MPELKEWVLNSFLEPIGPGISALPDTYPWRRFLSGVNASALYRALLPMVRGAIFTGPAGNGRHTQACAFAYTLMEQCLNTPGKFDQAGLIQIEPNFISPKLEERELLTRVNELYDTVEDLLKRKTETITVLFDQIDLYPHSMMDHIAERVGMQDSDKLFTICIAQSESKISRNLLRVLIHCRCLMPSSDSRKKYLQQIELFQIQDTWSTPFQPTEKNVAVEFDEITMDEIVEMTEGCSYADLADLLWLIKLRISNFNVDTFENTKHIVVRLSREDVTEAIKLCIPIAGEDRPAQLLAVQQAAIPRYPGVYNQPAAGNQHTFLNSTAELGIDDAINLIEHSY